MAQAINPNKKTQSIEFDEEQLATIEKYWGKFENIPANADDTAMEIINELYDKELYDLGLKVTYASISDPTSIYIEIKPDKELGWYKGSL